MTISTVIALAFAVLATAGWSRRPLAARVYVAAAAAYALAAVSGATPATAPRDGTGYVVALAGLAGLVALAGGAASLARGVAAARR